PLKTNEQLADNFGPVIDLISVSREAEVHHPGLPGPQEGMAVTMANHLPQVIDPPSFVRRALPEVTEVMEGTARPKEWVGHTITREVGGSGHLSPVVNVVSVTVHAAEGPQVGDGVRQQIAGFELLQTQPHCPGAWRWSAPLPVPPVVCGHGASSNMM